eukprot:gene12838-8732_t
MRLQLIKYAGGGPLNMLCRVPRPCPTPATRVPTLARPAGANPEHQKLHIDTIMVLGRLFCIQFNAATTNQICGRRSAGYASSGAQAMPHPGHPGPLPDPTPTHPAGANPEHQKLHIDTIMIRGRLFCIQLNAATFNQICGRRSAEYDSSAGANPEHQKLHIDTIMIRGRLFCIQFNTATFNQICGRRSAGYASSGAQAMPHPATRVPAGPHPTHPAGANPEHQKLHIDTIMVRGQLFCIQFNAATTNQICGRRSAEYDSPGAQAMPHPGHPGPHTRPPSRRQPRASKIAYRHHYGPRAALLHPI